MEGFLSSHPRIPGLEDVTQQKSLEGFGDAEAFRLVVSKLPYSGIRLLFYRHYYRLHNTNTYRSVGRLSAASLLASKSSPETVRRFATELLEGKSAPEGAP